MKCFHVIFLLKNELIFPELKLYLFLTANLPYQLKMFTKVSSQELTWNWYMQKKFVYFFDKILSIKVLLAIKLLHIKNI